MPLPQHAEQYPLHIAAAAAAAAAGAPAGAFLPAVSYPESQHEIYQQSGAAAHLNPQHLLYPPQIPAPMADAVDASAIAAPPLPPQRSSKAAPKIRLKINKKQLAAAAAAEAAAAAVASVAVPQDNEAAPEHPNFDSYAALPAQTMPPQPVAAAKTSASSAKAASKKAPIAPKVPSEPTRKLGRARKVVNYSEARSRSPSPARTTAAAAAADPDTAAAAAAASTNGAIRVVDEPEPTGSNECRSGGEMSPSKEHPPIKLRIFKVMTTLTTTTNACVYTELPLSWLEEWCLDWNLPCASSFSFERKVRLELRARSTSCCCCALRVAFLWPCCASVCFVYVFNNNKNSFPITGQPLQTQLLDSRVDYSSASANEIQAVCWA